MEESIASVIEFLSQHGYWVIFLWMFADQIALPLPSAPLLIGAGAIAATGALDLRICIIVATVATLLADLAWFELGKQRGAQAINFVCKLSLEPQACVVTTRRAFGRYGTATLLFAKYLPGVQTLAPASAGFMGAPRFVFLGLDLIGTLLYVVPACVGGYYFQPQISRFFTWLAEFSGGLTSVCLLVAGVYVAFKAIQWILFLRGHRLRRITPEQVYERKQSGEPLTIIDLRQRIDYQMQPNLIEGAMRIPINHVKRRRDEIPSRYDVVLVCT